MAAGLCCLILLVAPAVHAGQTPAQLPHPRRLAAHAATRELQQHLQDVPGTPSSSSSRRQLQQAQAMIANNMYRELPRLVIGKVKATVVNTYTWSIQRQSSASGVAVTADGYSRKQLGYQLAFTRTLQSTQYRLEGVAALTNPSGQGSATLLSLNILVSGRQLQAPCQGMPATQFTLPPAGVVECPFVATFDSDPGADAVSGYVQTVFGRAAASSAPVAYDFGGCVGGGGSGDGERAAACSVEEGAACVSVTDGSYIVNKYKDKLGQVLAGTVTRSRLFETSAVQNSDLGPPRIEPTTPVAVAQVSRNVPDTPPVWTPRMPDSSWWNGNRRRSSSKHRRALLTLLGSPLGHESTAVTSSSSSSRQLLQSPKDALVASFDANFQWPYPTVTGDRPPVGLQGRPDRGSVRQICGSRTFSYGMVWGPLLPAACGTFEVQNFAGALPVDGSSPAVTTNTYTYLQVVCPTAVAERASRGPAAAAADGGGRRRLLAGD